MQMVDLETSISDFLTLGRQLQSLQLLTGERVLNELIALYRENRIVGTSLIDDGDMLLLQWGIIRPLDILEPTDVREIDDSQIKFSNSRFQYLNFTRQIFVNYGDKNVEFDGVAVQMRISLCYQPTTENETSSGLWIETPNEIEHGEGKFRSTPYVNMLIRTPAARTEIIVEHCG